MTPAIRPTPLDRPSTDTLATTPARRLCAGWRRAQAAREAELRAQDEADEAAYQAEGDRRYGNGDVP